MANISKQLQKRAAQYLLRSKNSAGSVTNASNPAMRNAQMTQGASSRVRGPVPRIPPIPLLPPVRSGVSEFLKRILKRIADAWKKAMQAKPEQPVQEEPAQDSDSTNTPEPAQPVQEDPAQSVQDEPAQDSQDTNVPAQEQPVQDDSQSDADAGPALLNLPTMSPLEELLIAHPEITTNQDLINYFVNEAGDLGKAYVLARSIYSVEIDDLCDNRKGTVDTTKPNEVFANKNQIFSYLVLNLGMSNAGACGVLANIQSESNFNTSCVGDGGTSYGLCQWHNSRKTDLINYCSTNGYELDSIEGQLAFLGSELATKSAILNAMKNAENTEDGAYDAASVWCKDFEVPADAENAAKTRGEVAKKYFQTYGNVTVGTAPKAEKPSEPAGDVATEETASTEPVVDTEPEVTEDKDKGKGAEEKQDDADKATDGYVETSNDKVNKIQKTHPNGITVSLYGSTDDFSDQFGNKGYDTKPLTNDDGSIKYDSNGNVMTNKPNNAEFASVAVAGGSQTNSVAESLDMGSAIMANAQSAAKSIINNVYTNLHNAYVAAKPASAKDEPEHLKIKNLSLYYHGGKNSLGFPRASLNNSGVDDFVSEIKSALKSDVHVQLYACNTAGNDNGFASTMAKSLGGDARVYGHLNAGHTIENSNARYFTGDGTAVNMFDALMPDSWVRQEAVRIWGADYTDAAYNKLVERLELYYKDVCGMSVGWNSDRRLDFEACTPDYPKAYSGSAHYSAMGRYMFYDTDNASKLLQAGWRHWALNNEKTNLSSVGALVPSFDVLDAFSTESVQEEEPAQTLDTAEAEGSQQPQTKKDSSSYVVIGDSRTVGMASCASLGVGKVIAEVGMGYNWLVKTALPEAEKTGLTNYVILLGVNDLYQSGNYVKKYNELVSKGINLTIVTVGPMQEGDTRWQVKNPQIEEFNAKISQVPGANIVDLYSHMKATGYSTTDGLHYTKDTYKEIASYLESNW